MDVDDTQEIRLREKLGNNTKLWFLCFVVLVAATIYYSIAVHSSYSSAPISTVELGGVAKGTHDDAAHSALTDDVTKLASKRGVAMTTRFVDVNTLELIVPSDTAADEISFLSRFAATATYRKFGNVPVVYVYTKNSLDSSEEIRLTAITRWSERERNFLAKFQRSIEGDSGS